MATVGDMIKKRKKVLEKGGYSMKDIWEMDLGIAKKMKKKR